MNALSAYTGVTTASALAPTAMPQSILFDTSPTADLLPTFALQSALSYTLPDQSAASSATGIVGGVPAVVSFFNTDGSIGYTTLPTYRLATVTATATATASGMTMSATGSNSTASMSQPTAFNAGGVSIAVTKKWIRGSRAGSHGASPLDERLLTRRKFWRRTDILQRCDRYGGWQMTGSRH